jgi:hypothetical protein
VFHIIRGAFFVLLLLMVIASGAPAGLSGGDASLAFAQGRRDPFGDRHPPTPEEIKLQKAQAKAQKKEKYEALRKETDQLLALATELKEDVDKTTEDTLSLDVIRKTEQVEKLAKQVREKMRGY